jgi:hypothetical protein
MVILLKGNQRLLDSFLSTDLGKLCLKIENVQINPRQGAQMKTWMKFIITFIKTIEVPFWRLLVGSPAISNAGEF